MLPKPLCKCFVGGRHRLPLQWFFACLACRIRCGPDLFAVCLAVAVIFAACAIDAEEIFSFMDGRLLALIFSMLAIGAALKMLGVVELIVNLFVPSISHMPPLLVI